MVPEKGADPTVFWNKMADKSQYVAWHTSIVRKGYFFSIKPSKVKWWGFQLPFTPPTFETKQAKIYLIPFFD